MVQAGQGRAKKQPRTPGRRQIKRALLSKLIRKGLKFETSFEHRAGYSLDDAAEHLRKRAKRIGFAMRDFGTKWVIRVHRHLKDCVDVSEFLSLNNFDAVPRHQPRPLLAAPNPELMARTKRVIERMIDASCFTLENHAKIEAPKVENPIISALGLENTLEVREIIRESLLSMRIPMTQRGNTRLYVGISLRIPSASSTRAKDAEGLEERSSKPAREVEN